MIEYKNIFWKNYQGALVPNTPPHINIELNKKDERFLLKKSNAYFLRYTSKWDINIKTNFWYIIKDSFIGFEELSKNTRNQVRKAFKNCTVKKVDKNIIIKDGYEVYNQAFKNYTTHIKPLNVLSFQENIEKSNYDFFAVYNAESRMIAYAQNTLSETHCEYNVVKIHPDYLKLYPSYALFYEMNKYYLDEMKLDYVCDGARSISHETNIQNFLESKFKFRKSFCKLNLAYRKDILVLVLLLYPFKKIINLLSFNFAKKIQVLLKQEEIKRSFNS